MKKNRKPYTLSEDALQQRRVAARKPRKRLKENFNAFKNGKYSSRINLKSMPFHGCKNCFFYELVKLKYDIVVIKKKNTDKEG